MPVKRVVIADYDLLTAYGVGVGALWDGLMSGRTAVRPCEEFDVPALKGISAAAVPMVDCKSDSSRFMRMLRSMFSAGALRAPVDSALVLATTIGETDLLEGAVMDSTDDAPALTSLLPKVRELTGAGGAGVVISSACASATAALAYAGTMLRHGRAEAALVVGADSLSEFVLSGFSSLMALDEGVARPFDRDRAGLTVGEAAGYMLLLSEERAAREGRAARGFLLGAAMTDDANHMTGPSRDGSGLASAIAKALAGGGSGSGTIALVAAHGTGTVYSDAMEMKALRSVFPQPVPTFSIKGGIGHTMGNAGLAQAVVALESLRRGLIPPTVGVSHVDDDAVGWVSPESQDLRGNIGVVANAGFGGVNAAVVLEVDATTRDGNR